MKEVSVAQAAAHLDVSEHEIRRRLSVGALRGEKLSGVWLVDPTSLGAVSKRRGRPLSRDSAWDLALLLDGDALESVGPVRRHRARQRGEALRDQTAPLPLVRAWMANRADVHRLTAFDPSRVLGDPRVYPSGVNDPRSFMSAAGVADGYVRAEDVDAVIRDLILAPAVEEANVVLRVVEELPPEIPWLMVVADLADGGPREAQQAEALMQKELREG